MKNLIFVLSMATFILTTIGCSKEKDPVQVTNTTTATGTSLLSYSSDTMYSDLTNLSPQSRILLMQEFTGIYCYTCPLAHDITANILQLYPNRVAAMNIHSHLFGIYDDPGVMGNLYDFRTLDGDSTVTMLGGVFSVPSAAFNMTLLNGESNIISFTRANWINYANTELGITPQANAYIETSFNASNRNLKIVVKYHLLNNMAEGLNYNVALVENDIIDKQFVDTAMVTNYHHQHIFRDMITDVRGDTLTNTPMQGDVYIKVINYTVPSTWNENNVQAIAYVHKRDTQWDVLQTAFSNIK